MKTKIWTLRKLYTDPKDRHADKNKVNFMQLDGILTTKIVTTFKGNVIWFQNYIKLLQNTRSRL